MRLGRHTGLLLAFSVLTSAAAANAECAWVLWQFDGGQWTTLTASHQRTECDRDRVRHYGLGEQAPPPGIGTLIEGRDGKNFFMRYDSLPDSVDPPRAEAVGSAGRAVHVFSWLCARLVAGRYHT